jgi:hypothetical protein
MKKLLLLLASVVISCSTPENVKVINKTTVAQPVAVIIPPVLHVPVWLQGNYYKTNAFGGMPLTTGNRLLITANSIETEFDDITYLNGNSIITLRKGHSMTVFNRCYSNLREEDTVENGAKHYRVWGNDISQGGQSVLIYSFFDGYPNCIMFKHPENTAFRRY